ncbi:MAG TPA: hypothetical protein PLQ76_08845, partial [bacterium]|nr:hypothetical protein [bacterium]
MAGEVQARASKALNEPLILGKTDIDFLGRVIINGVRLGPENEPIFRAERAVISISFLNLLKQGSETGDVVKGVGFRGTELNVIRRKDGKYNYYNLVKGTSGKGAALPKIFVNATGGRLFFEDRYEKAPYPIRRATVSKFVIKLNLRRERIIDITMRTSDTDLCRRLGLKLKFDLRAGWRLDSTMEGVPLAKMSGFFKSKYSMKGEAEKLRFYAEAAFTRVGNPPVFSWGGEGVVRHAKIAGPAAWLRSENVSGVVEFNEKAVSFNEVEADYANGTMRGNATVAGYANPIIMGSAEFEGCSVKKLSDAMGLKFKRAIDGKADGTARIVSGGGVINAG